MAISRGDGGLCGSSRCSMLCGEMGGGFGCDALLWMVSARREGKNVCGEDGQVEQQQWKMRAGMQRERSVRWCVGLCARVLRCRRSVSCDGNGVVVLSAEWVQPRTGQK